VYWWSRLLHTVASHDDGFVVSMVCGIYMDRPIMCRFSVAYVFSPVDIFCASQASSVCIPHVQGIVSANLVGSRCNKPWKLKEQGPGRLLVGGLYYAIDLYCCA
jgi:hypothetical protein